MIRRSATKQGSIRVAFLSLLFAVPLAVVGLVHMCISFTCVTDGISTDKTMQDFRIWPQEESWTSAPPQESPGRS